MSHCRRQGAVLMTTFSLWIWGTTSICAVRDLVALFQDAKTTAAQLKRDVEEMAPYARSNLSWQSHAAQITRIKEHVNRAGEVAAQLQQSRSGAQPWHQTAIDRLTPLLKELASNVEEMIQHINKQKNMIDPGYTKYLKKNEELATELSSLISETVEYDKTKTEMQEP